MTNVKLRLNIFICFLTFTACSLLAIDNFTTLPSPGNEPPEITGKAREVEIPKLPDPGGPPPSITKS